MSAIETNNKRKREEETEDDKETQPRKSRKRTRRERLARYRQYLDKLVTFHTREEVQKSIGGIIDQRIDQIFKVLNISKIALYLLPKAALKEEVEKIIFKGVQAPLRNIVAQMPKQVECLIELSERKDKDEPILGDITEMVKKAREEEKKEVGEKKTPNFAKFINKLRVIRRDITRMIVEALNNDALWSDIPLRFNIIESLDNEKLLNICGLIYTAIVAFSVTFSRYFIEDEEGVYADFMEFLNEERS